MKRATALTLLVAIAVSGCGSAPLSTSQLRSAATQICTEAGGLTARIQTPSSPSEGKAFLARGAAVLGPELVSLRSLRASGDAAPVYSTAMVAFQHKLGAIRASIRDLGRGLDPVIAIKTLQQQLTPVEVQENAAWQRLGIPACVNR